MRRASFESQFGPIVADHWKKNHPEEAEHLRKTGRLIWEADKAAFKTAEQLALLRADNVPAEDAYDAITLWWDKPPEPAERRRPSVEVIPPPAKKAGHG